MWLKQNADFINLCYFISMLKTDSHKPTHLLPTLSGKSQFWHIESFELVRESYKTHLVSWVHQNELVFIEADRDPYLRFLNEPRIRAQNLMKQTVPYTISSELHAW